MLKKTLSLLAVAIMIVAVPLSVLARPLTPQAFAVERASYQHWVFDISRSARVFGQFRSQGGDIRVYVIDEDQFENFKRGADVRSYYSSGQVPSGQVDLRLRFGRYVVVFDNRFPPHSNKTITSNLQIEE